jgi:hypothetical protein
VAPPGIGRRLVEAKEIAGHGNWLPWLEREFSWSSSTAGKYMNVYRMFQHRLSGKYVGATDLTIDIGALKTLAAPTTPDDVRDEAEQRADRGEHLSAADVQQMIDEARAKQEAEAEHNVTELRDAIARPHSNRVQLRTRDGLAPSKQCK